MIYIHIGLPKTATTFFQERVFPNWDNIEYLGRNIGRDVPFKRFVNTKKENKYLLSEEGIGSFFKSCDEREISLRNISEMVPDARILISFRKHKRLITSLYQQSIKRGETFSRDDFYDIVNDEGLLKKDALVYRNYIDDVNKYFDHEPFVYLQEELKNNFPGLLSDMSDFFEEEGLDINKINLQKINEGIGYYQGKLLFNFNKLFESPINPDGLLPYNNYTRLTREISREFCTKLSPLSKKPLVMTGPQQKFIDAYYEEDWNYTLNYIDSECTHRKNFDILNYKLKFN